MQFPGLALRAERNALGITEGQLAVMANVRPAVIVAWEAQTLMPSDSTIRVTICVLVMARRLHAQYGFVPVDESTIRWLREQIVATLGAGAVA